MSNHGGAESKLRISALDAADLLFNVYAASNDPEIGYEDADRTIDELSRQLSLYRYKVDIEPLQSALWSCNMRDETNAFWSSRQESFDMFVKRLLSTCGHPLKFNKDYNLILPKYPKGSK